MRGDILPRFVSDDLRDPSHLGWGHRVALTGASADDEAVDAHLQEVSNLASQGLLIDLFTVVEGRQHRGHDPLKPEHQNTSR